MMDCNTDYCELEQWPVKRDLDGVYFRVQRDGKWVNLCFTDLTMQERFEVSKDRPAEWWKVLAMHFAEIIRQIGDTYDCVGGDGDGANK